jgi:hypothetical protein
MKGPPCRYYFSGMRVGNIARRWSAGLLAGSLVAMAILRNPVAWGIFGVSALASAYGMFRAKEPKWFVELGENHLVVHGAVKTKIGYDDIASADYYRYRGGVAGVLENFGVLLGRIFGRQWEYGAPGEVNKSAAELRFSGIKWKFFPLPPFVLPRRSWLLAVEDAPSLRAEIDQRLPRPSGCA